MSDVREPSPSDGGAEEISFPELPGLLHAYESTQVVNHSRDGSVLAPGDLDTAEEPSRAMRTYLRMAARHPGRAVQVVSELEFLLERGPEDDVLDALDNAGVVPEQLRPSDGKDPDEFFELMLTHLRKFIASGERVAGAIPESRWEWRERYASIGGLLGGGFHLDSLDFHGTHDAVMEDYIQGEQVEYIQEMLSDIEDLRSVAPTDEELEWALAGIGCGLLPPQGMTPWQWMDHIEARLRRYVRENS